jgi:hypothetical protein
MTPVSKPETGVFLNEKQGCSQMRNGVSVMATLISLNEIGIEVAGGVSGSETKEEKQERVPSSASRSGSRYDRENAAIADALAAEGRSLMRSPQRGR